MKTKVKLGHIIFRQGRDNNRSKIASNKPQEERHLSIISFNCKNVKTSVQPINTLIFKSNDIILLQEHWLFEFQINNLGEINDSIHFAWKGWTNITQWNQPKCHEATVE